MSASDVKNTSSKEGKSKKSSSKKAEKSVKSIKDLVIDKGGMVQINDDPFKDHYNIGK